MTVPQPTPLYRLVHLQNLPILIARGALHAPNQTPADGVVYRPIHNTDVQANRHMKPVRCGPGGSVHDYLPFYFGPLSPMLLNLKTGRVPGYAEGQEPLIYLVTAAQAVAASGARFVFTDGHGLATFTNWFDDLARLDAVDWNLVDARYWSDKPEDNDRQRRKQAEFLVHGGLPWSLIQGIGVYDAARKLEVEAMLAGCSHRPPVVVKRDWYYA